MKRNANLPLVPTSFNLFYWSLTKIYIKFSFYFFISFYFFYFFYFFIVRITVYMLIIFS